MAFPTKHAEERKESNIWKYSSKPRKRNATAFCPLTSASLPGARPLMRCTHTSVGTIGMLADLAVRALQQRGFSLREISRRLLISRETVRRFVRAESFASAEHACQKSQSARSLQTLPAQARA